MSYTTKVSTCSLNQHALAFSLNLANLKAAVDAAKADNSKYLLTPELSLCGYGCEDHFLEPDTESHCWEILAELLPSTLNCPNFLLDVGMPIVFNGSRFNCRVLVCDGRIVGIRPKTVMADDGNYREGRWFTPWCRGVGELEEYLLPKAFIDSVPGSSQRTAPFGLMVFRTSDGLKLSVETCEELWSPESPNIELSLLGVEVIANGSGSHHEVRTTKSCGIECVAHMTNFLHFFTCPPRTFQLRKLHRRLELIIEATKKNGGVYLYSNQRGCDGSRVYYDGSSMIVCNGQVLRQGVQFGLKDVEVRMGKIKATHDTNFSTYSLARRRSSRPRSMWKV
jgi:NAD+ synthase (glutamine-hydrolysing)